MRIGVVDIGTNSTRLLIADVDSATRAVTELERRSEVTRLGQGVDSSGRLADEAVARVYTVLDEYRSLLDAQRCEATTAVLTSAVRDAANGEELLARVRDHYRLDARTITGDEEARLTFLGATSEASPELGTALVIDIGGGSTEYVVGSPGGPPSFHVSTQAGVVRQSERHITHDPPEHAELEKLRREIRTGIEAVVPARVRKSVDAAIAVAGTATSCAAIAQELDPYDPNRVHGFRLELGVLEEQLARLAQMTDEERRHVKGLHPDRAPTIVAGVIILEQALRSFGLESVTASEHDILRGAALDRAAGPR